MKTALTPLDGRYFSKVTELTEYLSEDALIKYRAKVEFLWLAKLISVLGIDGNFNEVEANIDEVKAIEQVTHHDVKAVEIWITRELEKQGKKDLVPYVHFGRTSEDINNLAYALMIKDSLNKCLMPVMNDLVDKLHDISTNSKSVAMLTRTHGQPASPSTFGKEMFVFVSRLKTQVQNINNVNIYAKLGGATGTYAADYFAHPDIDWVNVAKEFVDSLGLNFNSVTTQIEPHDWIARLSNELALFNTISINLCRDIWQYISLGYLNQKIIKDEVGSSTMPHKVNPIDFENAEANFGLANALLRHFADKLPISRLQRDLSDSSVMRTHSEAYGHMIIGLKSLLSGLSKIVPNIELMNYELSNHWELLSEAVQTIMRKNGIADAYNQLKEFTRGQEITKAMLHEFINSLEIADSDKKRLLELTPETYIGISDKLVS